MCHKTPLLFGLIYNCLCAQRIADNILDVLQSQLRGLDKTYERVLKQIHERPEQLQELAQKYLMRVFYAIRPLTTIELQHVIAIEWPESKKIQPIYEIEIIFESC